MFYWKYAAMGLLGLLLALSWARGNHYQHKAQACSEGRAEDRRLYAAAQVVAQAKAVAAKAAVEAQYRDQANAADTQHTTQMADARTATDLYIRQHRVRDQAATGSRGGAVAPAQGGGAQGADRPDPQTDMVEVSATDIDICTVNTTRLLSAQEWAQGLTP